MSSAPVQTPSSGAPILIDAVPDYVVDQKWFYEPLTYNLNDYFKDPDGGPLTYTAKILDPAWAAQGISTIDFGFQITESGVLQIGVDYGWSFTFGPSQYTQKTYHTPQIQNPVEIQVTATDADGHSVSDIFGLSQKSDELGLTNRAPVFEHDRDTDVAPQSFVVHEVGGINIGGRWFHAGWWQRQEIGNFEDPDGEKLTLTATLADGSPLPSWLHLTSEQDRTSTKAILWVSGAEDTDIGSYDIRITATDAAGASATHETSFTLFPKSNQAPTFISYPTLHTSGFFEDLRKVSLDVANGESFVQDVSAFFYDHDGDVLTYSLASATGQDIPAWLSINATTGVMTVTPGAEDRGFYEVKVLASDPFGAKVTSHTMEFSVAAPNRAPVLD
ncbi:MAG: putative Ig domain-containing protein, partial [Rhodospirillaceae bacterium]